MLSQSAFFSKYKIDPDEFEKTGLFWNDLKIIYDDHSKNIGLLETTGNYISDRLRKTTGVHSVKQRIKNPEHLIEKIIRKRIENGDREINLENYKSEITDLIGIRALHLFKSDWLGIHDFIVSTWILKEKPTANIREGDPHEVIDVYEDKDCNIKRHPYGYRSVHYLVKSSPTKEEYVSEVQVRTIFEEGWSEIDHQIRYPNHTDDRILSQFLVVFNRLAGSADEMGSYIQFLSGSLEEREILHQKELSEKAAAIEKLKKEINDLQIDKRKKQELQVDIDLISPTSISFSGSHSTQSSQSKKSQQSEALNAPFPVKKSAEAFRSYKKELKTNGFITLEGFWEKDNGFDGDLCDLKPDNILSVKIADVGSRESVFVVLDNNGKPVGMLPNSLTNGGDFNDFMISIVRSLKSNEFKVKIISLPRKKKNSDRQYFTCRTCE